MIATLTASLAHYLPTALPRRCLPPGSLTHEQLLGLRRLALATGDAKLHRAAHKAMGAVLGGVKCPIAMAECVAVQAELEGQVQRAQVGELAEVA